ncbi:MAG TPA: biotin/lipoyl-containing protein [Sporichthyaceae bacterium]
MVHDITMPKLGETVTEGTVGSWLKQVGDTVAFDDPLYEVSTDKVDSEIPSPYDGVLLEILVANGGTAPVGAVLARIGEPGAAGGSVPGGGDLVVGGSDPATVGALTGRGGAPSVAPAATSADRGGGTLSPLVRRLLVEAGLDSAQIKGTGAGGRIRREVLERAVAAGAELLPRAHSADDAVIENADVNR